MTTNQDHIETVVRRVAEGLGWDKFQFASDSLPSYRPDPSVVGAYYGTNGHALIILAAYAEAAMARTWNHESDIAMADGSRGSYSLKQRGVSYYHRDHPWQEYNPADPVSKAEAILRAVDEAIGGGG